MFKVKFPKVKKSEVKFYEVFNETDGIPASPHSFKTKKEAQDYITQFRARYSHQGYYFTSNMERINPKDVKLKIVAY
jgi:hypothetical protein